jgi:hypothetical protein
MSLSDASVLAADGCADDIGVRDESESVLSMATAWGRFTLYPDDGDVVAVREPPARRTGRRIRHTTAAAADTQQTTSKPTN